MSVPCHIDADGRVHAVDVSTHHTRSYRGSLAQCRPASPGVQPGDRTAAPCWRAVLAMARRVGGEPCGLSAWI